MTWAAVIIVIGQALIIGLLLVFVRTFGAYTDALIRTHDSNVLLYRQSLKVLEYAEQVLAKEKKAS